MIVGGAAELAYSPIFFSKSQQEVDFFNCRDLLPPPFICYISLSSTYCLNPHRVPIFTSDFPNIPEYDYGTSLHHDVSLEPAYEVVGGVESILDSDQDVRGPLSNPSILSFEKLLSCRNFCLLWFAILHSRHRNVLVSAVLLLFRGIFDTPKDINS